MNFDSWFAKEEQTIGRAMARSAWNHQQFRIDALEDELKRYKDAFYGERCHLEPQREKTTNPLDPEEEWNNHE
jgi:hypothetical protein